MGLIGLIITFAVIVIVGKQKDSRELQQASTSNYDANSTIASETQKVVETKVESPYVKLSNKEDILVLVLCDALAEGAGLKDSEKWTALLKSNLDSAYSINSTIKLSTVSDGNALSSGAISVLKRIRISMIL